MLPSISCTICHPELAKDPRLRRSQLEAGPSSPALREASLRAEPTGASLRMTPARNTQKARIGEGLCRKAEASLPVWTRSRLLDRHEGVEVDPRAGRCGVM